MDDILLIDAIERYYKGEMSPKELSFFEEMRKKDPAIDQFAVEHIFFLQELDRMSHLKEFRSTVDSVENSLINEGIIARKSLGGKAKVAFMYNKFRRTIAVAASIAGIVSIFTAGIISVYSGKKAETNLTPLVNDKFTEIRKEINQVKEEMRSGSLKPVSKPKFEANFNATGFLIDSKGYIATNAHVIKDAKNLIVENKSGEQFSTKVIYVNKRTDLAILKITDSTFRRLTIPYSIRKTNAELGEQIFTLGYPREIAVYGEGYLSARIGFSGDTLSYQVSISVNPGNSGGPVFTKNGEVIGIISSKETNADGVVFAISSKNIYKALEEIKAVDTIHLPTNAHLRGMERQQQIRKIEDCVFMVKGN